MNHAERYEHLVNKMTAIRCRGSDLDASYHAALFLVGSKRLHVNFEIPAYKFAYMGKAGGR